MWSAQPQRGSRKPLPLPNLPTDLLPWSRRRRSLWDLCPAPPLLPRVSHSGTQAHTLQAWGWSHSSHGVRIHPPHPHSQRSRMVNALLPPRARPYQGHGELGRRGGVGGAAQPPLKAPLPLGHFSSAISPGVQENRKPTSTCTACPCWVRIRSHTNKWSNRWTTSILPAHWSNTFTLSPLQNLSTRKVALDDGRLECLMKFCG